MISIIIAVILALAIAFLYHFGKYTEFEARWGERINRQQDNMSLAWGDGRFHPTRPICRKHEEFYGENQPEGKCSDCGILIRYNLDPKYVSPAPKTPLRKIKKYFEKLFVIPAMNKKFAATPAIAEVFYNPDPRKIFIINVVFYDADMVALHYGSLKKFLCDDYEYFVLDNTDEVGRSERVRNYCVSQKIHYVRLPSHDAWARWHDSTSHGLALNWSYANIIKRFKPKVFGFMDGDLFPVQPVSILKYMDQTDVWGIIADRRPFWHFWSPIYYAWPGLSFFRTGRFVGRMPNFMAGWGVDTAGRELIDGKDILARPEVYDLFTGAPWMEVEPKVYVHMMGRFAHFTGASWQPFGAEAQKKWIASLLE